MKITKTLADFAANISFNEFPEEVVEHAKLCILDWIGVALAGAKTTLIKILTSVIEENRGKKESTIIGRKTKTSCLNATLINGVMGHVLELDDVHEESVMHPAAPVVPAALAVAERKNASGKDLITSVIVGYEVEIRIGMSVMPSHYEFWHTTGTCGTFGAAVAAGRILGLGEERTIHAIGIAGTQAAGLVEVFGTMSKPLNVGKAAMNGVISAFLSEKGFTSSSTILEAGKGYCRATSKEFNFSKLTEDLGKNFELMDNIFKRHASCGHTHGAIDATLWLSDRYDVRPEKIREILVETYPIAVKVVGKNAEPRTAFEAKFSLPYCVAVTLIYGKVGLAEFSEEKLTDPKVIALAKKVKVISSPEYSSARLGCARVKFTTDSKEYDFRVDTPKGYPRNPLTKTELRRKFVELSSLVLPGEQVTEIMQVVFDLEKLGDIEELTTLFSRARQRSR